MLLDNGVVFTDICNILFTKANSVVLFKKNHGNWIGDRISVKLAGVFS